MKKLAYILLLSLPFFGAGCQQKTGGDTGEGYGAENPQYGEDSESGAGQVDETGMGADVSNNGGTMQNTTSTGDTMHTPGEVGADEAARSAEKTQRQVGNSQTRGEVNNSRTQPANAQSSKGSEEQKIPQNNGGGQ